MTDGAISNSIVLSDASWSSGHPQSKAQPHCVAIAGSHLT
jgi:hypothetical protein